MLIVFEWLGIAAKVPDWTSIRFWLIRVGVAALEETVERADDWTWLVDHSNQIRPEKVLAILGVRASQMPPPGTPLSTFLGAHAMMRRLAVVPGTSWKTADMSREYLQLATRIGAPRAVLANGAQDARDRIKTNIPETLTKQRQTADRELRSSTRPRATKGEAKT